jgi:hypothetical protein
MKATLEFALPKEAAEMNMALDAARFPEVISCMSQWLSDQMDKDDISGETADKLYEAKTKLWSLVEEHWLFKHF